jgi:hypothetical protein
VLSGDESANPNLLDSKQFLVVSVLRTLIFESVDLEARNDSGRKKSSEDIFPNLHKCAFCAEQQCLAPHAFRDSITNLSATPRVALGKHPV